MGKEILSGWHQGGIHERIGLLIGFCTVLLFVLPALVAQAPKKDGGKAEKKVDPANDDKKDPQKKDEKVKLVYAFILPTKIISINNRDLTVDGPPEIDPKKVYAEQTWQAQQMQQCRRSYYDASMQKDFQQRYIQMQNYQKSLYTFQMELAKRKNNIYTTKPLEVRAAEDVKIRSLMPPVEFDDLGFQKKWTKKELEERKDKTGLPGFDVDLDALKSGQYVEIYLTKKPGRRKLP